MVYIFVYSNLLVATIAFWLTYNFSKYLLLENALFYGLVAFGATLFSYNLQRIHRLSDFESTLSLRHKWLFKHHILLKILMFFGFLLALIIYFLKCFDWFSFPLLIGLSGITFLYAYRGKKRKRKPLRDMTFLKIHLIAITWVVVVFLWPAIDANALSFSNWMIVAGLYSYFIAITIPFDIRDLDYDMSTQGTIPQMIGVNKAKIVSVLLLVLAACIFSFVIPQLHQNPFVYLVFIGHLLFILFTSKKQPDLYFSLGIDGWLFWLGFLF